MIRPGWAPSFLLAGVLFLSGTRFGTAAENDEKGKLVWSDEFSAKSGSLPDPSKWSAEISGGGFGNHELESYTNLTKNVQQRGGHLVITARKERYTGPDRIERDYTSARLQTKGHFAQRYGRFEARMKLPAGHGIWPAFWLLGDDVDSNHWPVCGEIDILEAIGDPHTIYSTLHGPGYSGGHAISAKFELPKREKFDGGFHVYAVDWEPGRIRFFFDDHLIVERTPKDLPQGERWVYDHPFFVLLNLAVGGAWPGNPNDQTKFPKRLLIDYVRVYDRPGQLAVLR